MTSCVCQSCGNIIHLFDEKCPYCGSQNPNQEAASQARARPHYIIGQPEIIRKQRGPYNKWTTFFLCLFLGYLGIHKFYEGKNGLGVIYLFTFGLLGLGVFVDLIIALSRPYQYYL